METTKLLSRFRPSSLVAMAMLLMFVLGPGELLAQKTDYRPGEKIEYKASYSKDEWAEGTFVEPSYDGKQPVIKDSGKFQIALPDWNWIRPVRARPIPPAAVPALPAPVDETPDKTPAGIDGGGVMSQAEVLALVRTKLGANPATNPRREDLLREIGQVIKRRGVNFHHDGLSPFANELTRAVGGMDLDLTWTLKENFGPATKQSWLIGSWRLDIVGATTEFEKGGDIYRKEASAAANVGKLTVAADGSYVWRANFPVANFRGRWRKATAAEMKTQGGDGIVLLGAKSGYDWIVMQNRVWTKQGDVVSISDLNTRQLREIGLR
ncbi:MAG: hypothetical protein ABI672_10310 [Vicinamibacteria bacterium]